MTARLPGTCCVCSARVELRLEGESVERTFIPQAGVTVVLDLPMAWCEPGTFDTHECVV